MIFFSRHCFVDDSPNSFWRLKRKNESLGLVTLKGKDLPKNLDIDLDAKKIKEYFKTGVYSYIDFTDESVLKKDFSWKTDEEQYKIKAWKYFCKRVWLTEDYLTYGKLEHPVNLFWFPKFDKVDNTSFIDEDDGSPHVKDVEKGSWVVINGFGRNKFLNFFVKPEDDIEVLAFNTFGKKVNFSKIFKKDQDCIEAFGPGYSMRYTLNLGTALPFVNSSLARKVDEICSDYQRKIYDWFKSTEITSNVKLSTYNLQPPNIYHKRKIKGNVHFELTPDLLEKDEKNKYSHPDFDFNMVKICMLLPLIGPNRDFYQDEKFTIKYTAY